MNEERVEVFEEDPITGSKTVSVSKSYQMTPVIDRIGVKVNLDDRYYDQQAINSYKTKGLKLMKMQEKLEH